MSSMLQFLGDWGHALAAALFAALAVWVSRGQGSGAERRLLVTALGMTAFWALYAAFSGMRGAFLGISECLRNAAWLLFIFALLHRGEGRQTAHPRAVTVIYGVLGILLALQIGIALYAMEIGRDTDFFVTALDTVKVLRMMVAAGALLLVHHLFTISAPEGRARIGLLMAALVAMWTYDLNLYALSYLSGGDVDELFALRGIVMAFVAPVMALSARAAGGGRLRLSRTVAFRSLSLVAVGVYIIVVAVIMMGIDWIAGPYARIIEIGAIFFLAVAVLGLVPARGLRALIKVQVAKHFFQHRYDYRAEWMRFTDTMGRPGEDAAPFDQRVIKAVADITESQAALLMLPSESGGLVLQASWNWSDSGVPVPAISASDAAAIESTGWIVDLDSVRAGKSDYAMPEWMLADRNAWALVPLIHFDRLAGAILLARPLVDRKLDWEDFDMLRAAGRQVASYIREAQGQQALDDAQRFDEFNRRFAFIMHDIKNLVSQLSLLARNAERHADNPEFRADMVLTLRESVGRMNEMLARLSQHNRMTQEEPRAMPVSPIAERVVRTKGKAHPVEISGEGVDAFADPVRVEQILGHLVQNAIDASGSGAPVIVRLGRNRDCATIDVVDRGCGMTAEFIRRDLFKPFSSSKAGGFGIGAFEARELARAMNGRIEVLSRPGEGSCFTLFLPLAAQNGGHHHRERAA
ncbi:XrtA/PEP-CTERM system histidine kinase PrsK [Sphingobium phenoxybenzoativorans]|uniref:XrtA/PEP-CTERM system histidine kinase PrsK n=1 Tax=Sphingobium phenoxybenzoativorans TaxID=1592790 RepID=UPI000872623A|nr:XrtA/PEP-CTERM system histidine kinase PrsK [Sphingobium phenoxybenzoativorans]